MENAFHRVRWVLKASILPEPHLRQSQPYSLISREFTCHIQVNKIKRVWDFFNFVLGLSDTISGIEVKKMILKINLMCCDMTYILHLVVLSLGHVQLHYVSIVWKTCPHVLTDSYFVQQLLQWSISIFSHINCFRSVVWKHEQNHQWLFTWLIPHCLKYIPKFVVMSVRVCSLDNSVSRLFTGVSCCALGLTEQAKLKPEWLSKLVKKEFFLLSLPMPVMSQDVSVNQWIVPIMSLFSSSDHGWDKIHHLQGLCSLWFQPPASLGCDWWMAWQIHSWIMPTVSTWVR